MNDKLFKVTGVQFQMNILIATKIKFSFNIWWLAKNKLQINKNINHNFHFLCKNVDYLNSILIIKVIFSCWEKLSTEHIIDYFHVVVHYYYLTTHKAIKMQFKIISFNATISFINCTLIIYFNWKWIN